MTIDGDQPTSPGVQQIFVHPSHAIETLSESFARQLDEVCPTFVGFSQQHQVMAVVGVARLLLSFGSASGSDVSLNPKNRLDAKSIRFFLKLSRPIQVPVVGHRNRVHSQLFHLIKQSVYAIAAVKKGILRMKVQVREFGHRWDDGTRRNRCLRIADQDMWIGVLGG